MNTIKKLLDAIGFSSGIYPYIVVLNTAAAVEALQELQNYEPLLDDLRTLLSEVHNTRDKLNELMEILGENKEAAHSIIA